MGSAASDKTAPTGKSSPSKSAASKMHRRSRSGCFTCRLRRKKCDEGKPKCKACRHLGLDCEYKRPIWWSNNETRRKQKDHIKSIIKRTKTNEKSSSLQGQCARSTPPALSYSVPTSETFSDAPGHHTRASSEDSDDDYDNAFDPSFAATPQFYDPYVHHPLHAHPYLSHAPIYGHPYPYEVDVKTERQMFVNDIPTRQDSTISTFSTFIPPPPHTMLPSYTGEEWSNYDLYDLKPEFNVKQEDLGYEEGLDFNFFDFSHGPHLQQDLSTTIDIDDNDRGLFDHLLENVLPLMLPILEANQHGSVKSDVILPALENNKTYLHACLYAAATHARATGTYQSDNVKDDIIGHSWAFVNQIVEALKNDTNHTETLEATLGMITLQCCVGRADEAEKIVPEIPWHQHLQCATELVSRLNLPNVLEEMIHTGQQPPFNMTLTAWVDILGSTMLGRAPTFANTYRTKHLSGSASGLKELMGCHDSVMYILSEVACLDSLRVENKLDDIAICSHITSLAQQLDATEPTHENLQSPFSKSGALRPRQLSKNITAIFRKAARVYLCSLVPNYNRYEPATCHLIALVASMLEYIPSGPNGFDRTLVWPLLMCGASSIPTSPFRRTLAERVEALGDAADHGSFGRMVLLLHEVWRRNDEIAMSAGVCEATPVTAGSPGGSISTPNISGNSAIMTTGTMTPSSTAAPPKTQNVHWRDVMKQNGWDFLLI